MATLARGPVLVGPVPHSPVQLLVLGELDRLNTCPEGVEEVVIRRVEVALTKHRTGSTDLTSLLEPLLVLLDRLSLT